MLVRRTATMSGKIWPHSDVLEPDDDRIHHRHGDDDSEYPVSQFSNKHILEVLLPKKHVQIHRTHKDIYLLGYGRMLILPGTGMF